MYISDFLDSTSKTRSMKKIINELNFIKSKTSALRKRIKRQAVNCKKVLIKSVLDEGRLPKIYKEVLKLNSKEANSPIKKKGKKFEQTLY